MRLAPVDALTLRLPRPLSLSLRLPGPLPALFLREFGRFRSASDVGRIRLILCGAAYRG